MKDHSPKAPATDKQSKAVSERHERTEKQTQDKVNSIKVRATRDGFYANAHRAQGEEFLIDEADFSEVWMEKLKGQESRDPPEVEKLLQPQGPNYAQDTEKKDA